MQLEKHNIHRYRLHFEEEIVRFIHTMGPKGPLRDACERTLLSGGKRLRPLLVLLIAEHLGHGLDTMPAALGVECFHTASLIADDLPCMDDAKERRGIPALHRVVGEDVAILASYTLIAAGYEAILRNAKKMEQHVRFASHSKEVVLLALETASRCGGILGATQGQYGDLHPHQMTQEMASRIIDQKTGTLFEVAWTWGWLFGGGDVAQLPLVQAAALHLGRAFQIADDLQDQEKDRIKSNPVNIALISGEMSARALLAEEKSLFLESLQQLGLDRLPVEKLFHSL